MTNPYDVGMQKVADFTSALTGLSQKAKEVSPMVGIGVLAAWGLNSIMKNIQNNSRAKAVIEDLIAHDPVLSKAPSEQVMQFYASIYNVAPTLSTDKTAVRELLQQFVKFGRIDLATLKLLAETEDKLVSTQKNRSLPFSIKI